MKFVVMAAAALMVAGGAQAQDTQTIVLRNVPGLAQSLHNWFPGFITVSEDDVTLTTGVVTEDQALLSLPFQYSHPVRLKSEIHTVLHTIPVGSVGFDAGEYSSMIGPEHIYCFFRSELAQPYTIPECVRYVGMLGVKWATAVASSNIPTSMQPGNPVGGKPEIEEDGVTIDHAFRLQVRIDSWSRKVLRLRWMSEGKIISNSQVPLNGDGTATIEAGDGTITVSRDPADKTRALVSFAARP